MKTTLVITQRTDQQSPKQIDINALIKSVFLSDIDSGVVQLDKGRKLLVQVKGKYVPLEYSYVKTKKMHILDIITTGETVTSFHAVEFFIDHFTKNEHKKDFNIIIAYDEPSQILCVRLYKPLTIFERSLRKLVYEIVVKTYGSSWYKKTIEDLINNCQELKDVYEKVKVSTEQNHLNRIEVALEELDYAHLHKYLFSKVPPKSYSDVLDKELSDDNISRMSRDEIVSIIHDLRPMSLWERLFHNYAELNDLETELSAIQKLRNKVMHAKSITYNEYQTLNKLLKKWNALIEKAIEQTEVSDYTEIQNISVIQSLSALEGLIEAIVKPARECLIASSQKIMKSVIGDLKGTISLISNVDLSSFTRNLLSLSGLDLSNSEDEKSKNDNKEEKENNDGDDPEDTNENGDEPE